MGSREAFLLSLRCEEIVLGTVLGDGCLERNGSNVRLRIDHSASQKALVDWKFRELSELEPFPPRYVERWDKRTGQKHVNYRFSTRTTCTLNGYHSLFYGSTREKRIPNAMMDLLTSPLSIAVWYMDDGGRRSDCRSGYLNTNAYSTTDVEILKHNAFGLTLELSPRRTSLPASLGSTSRLRNSKDFAPSSDHT
ncbi:MAG: hypothetical protein LC775_19540 [Acidobacteria bacterium]|nr:hypothetical protein [Acidobacteriota bacterium]